MTSTGNHFLDQIGRQVATANRQKEARDRKADAQKRAAVRRAKSAGGKGGDKSRAALRAAGKRGAGGRGIAAKPLKSGKDFKGAADYALADSKSPQFIGAASDSIAAMEAAAKLRPDIKNPVGHIVLSLPPQTGRLDPQKWENIVADFRRQIDIDESFPCAAVRHFDTAHDHVHLIYSRVSVAGKVHSAENSVLKCMSAERFIEREHNLPLVPPEQFKNQGGGLKKGEIEKALRTGQAPARIEIKRALDVALVDSPTLGQLIERLELSCISVKVNRATTGKVSGLSFERDGIAFKASQIGREYGWKSLSQKLSTPEQIEVMNEQQTSPSPQLAKPVGPTSEERSDDLRSTEPVAVPTVPAFAPSPGGADPAVRKEIDRTTRPTRSSSQVYPPGFAGTTDLDDGLIGWVDTIGDRICISGRPKQPAGRPAQLLGLQDARGRTVAIKTPDGWSITDPKLITAEQQLESLIHALELQPGEQIEAAGRADWVEKVHSVAEARGLRQPSGTAPDAREDAEERPIECGEADTDELSSAPAPRA